MSKKIDTIVDDLSSLTVLEAVDLCKILEEKWGVTASVASAPAQSSSSNSSDQVQEKTSFNVALTDTGDKKIAVIKEVRAATGLGLKEAKELVDSVSAGGKPATVKENLKKEDAESLKKSLEGAGAKVSLL